MVLQNKRLLSVDVFRGITIALMILVNSPGNNKSYAWLHHAIWNGCKLADLVFPFFLFTVGVSIALSLRAKTDSHVYSKIIKRTIIIFLLGLFLNTFPKFDMETLRVFGVLQRIAICYFVAAILFLKTSIRCQILITILLLIMYWLLMTMGTYDLSMEGNLAAYIDRFIFSSKHLHGQVYDPEGLFSTLPAIASTLLGNLTGAWLLSNNDKNKNFFGMLILGLLSLGLGWIWSHYFPINKALWTSSYVLWTAGLALLLFSICYGLIDIKEKIAWSKPFEILGVNAIAAYFLHIFFLKIQAMIHISRIDGSPGNLRHYLTEHLFFWTTPANASLLYSLSYLGLWLLILTILYRYKIFIKI